MDPRDHQRLVVVWQPGSGIAVHNVKCGVFHLFVCFFHNPILVGVVPQHTRQATNGGVHNLPIQFLAMYTSVALESDNIYALWEPHLDYVNISIV